MAVLTESPFYRQIVAQEKRESTLETLDARLGPVPLEVVDRVRAISDLERLRALHRRAATVPSLEEFDRQLDMP